MLYGRMGSMSCHLRFLKIKIKKKKKRCMSLFESLMESITVKNFFFSLLISATHVFSLEFSPTQLLSFLLFTH